MSAPKMTFFPMFSSGNENSEWESNHKLLLLSLYVSRLASLVRFTDPNKQVPNVKSVFNFVIVDLVCKKFTDILFF